MTARCRPANRRYHETVAVRHEGQRFRIGLGRDRNGAIVEVFINEQKANSQIDVLASDGAILMSLLMQYGHPIEEIAHAMKRNGDGLPASILGLAAAEVLRAKDEG